MIKEQIIVVQAQESDYEDKSGKPTMWCNMELQTGDKLANGTNMGWAAMKEGTKVGDVIASNSDCGKFKRSVVAITNDDGSPKMGEDGDGNEVKMYTWRFESIAQAANRIPLAEIEARLAALISDVKVGKPVAP